MAVLRWAVSTALVLVAWLPTLLVYLGLFLLALHYLVPSALRAWFLPAHFRIGHFSLSAVHDVVYEPPRFNGEVKLRIGSVGFVRWNGSPTRRQLVVSAQGGVHAGLQGVKEGLRNAGRKAMKATDRDKDRCWFLLRCQGIEVDVSERGLEMLLRGGRDEKRRHDVSNNGDAGTSPSSTTKPELRPSASSRADSTSSHSKNLLRAYLPRLGLQRFLVYFALQLSFTVTLDRIAKIRGVVCAGGEVLTTATTDDLVNELKRSTATARGGGKKREEALEAGQREQEARAWIRMSRVKVTPFDSAGANKGDAAATAAVEMLDPLVIRIAAPLVSVPERPPPAHDATEPSRNGTSTPAPMSPASGPEANDAERAAPSTTYEGRRWTLRRGGVRLAIEFGGEGGPFESDQTSSADADVALKKRKNPDATLLVGIAAQGRTRLEREKLKEDEMRGLGRVAKTVDAGVHVRMQELERIVETFKAISDRVKGEDRAGSPTDKATNNHKPSPLVFLDSMSLELPSFLFTAQHKIPPVVLSSDEAAPPGSPSRPPRLRLPQEIAFALLVRGVSAVVEIDRNSREIRKDHREWLGRERQVSWRIGAEWKEIEGRVKLDGSEEDALQSGGKALSISASRLDFTSTWIPPFLVPHAEKTPLLPAQRLEAPHHNDSIVLMEVFLGEIRGQALYETVDAAIRIFKARSMAAKKGKPSPDRGPQKAKGGKISGLPQLVGAAVTAGMELRIQAPQQTASPASSPSGESVEDPFVEAGDPDDPFFRTWSAPEVLCLSFPSGQMTFGGEYVDRSVRRSEIDRRAAKRAAKQRRQSSAASRVHAQDFEATDEEQASPQTADRPTQALEDEYGVPPPPPLKNDYVKRRIEPAKLPTNLVKDLNDYGVQYRAHFSLTADTLNVYILAKHDDRAGEEGIDAEADAMDSDGSWPCLPSDPVRLDIIAIGPLELQSKVSILGDDKATPMHPQLDLQTSRGRHNFLLETAQVDLWRPVVMSCIRDILGSVSAVSRENGLEQPPSQRTSESEPEDQQSAHPPMQPFVNRLPADHKIHLALASFDMRIAGTDPKVDARSCRGIAVHSGPLIVQYILQRRHEPVETVDCAARSSLQLPEDIRLEVNALVNTASDPDPRIALVKIEVSDIEVDPVIDARASAGRKRYPGRRGDGRGENVDYGWETHGRDELVGKAKRSRRDIIPPRFDAETATNDEEKQAGRGLIVWPRLAARIRLQGRSVQGREQSESDPDAPLDEIFVHLETSSLELRLELFSIYLCLVAFSALRRLRSSTDGAPAGKSKGPSGSAPTQPRPLITVRGDCRDLHVWPTLPHDTHLYMNLSRVRFEQDRADGLMVMWDTGVLAGQSATAPGRWEDVVQLRGTEFRMRPVPGNDGFHPFVLSLVSESARLRIPFRYVFARIIDNTASLVKGTKQLIYEHVKGGIGTIIEPHAEKAKRLPQIEVQVGLFAVELQDDPFETKLNIIWRAGGEEQAARLDREAAFVAKAAAVERADELAAAGEDSSDSEDGRDPGRLRKVDARHSVSIEDARRGLAAYNSSSWIKRVRSAAAEQSRREEILADKLYGARDPKSRRRGRLPIDLAPVPKSAPLGRATFHGLSLVVSKPSFGDGEEPLADYLHDVGNGLPRDSTFSLLIPVHLSWKMEEARFQLRDYPLPLMHVPRGGEGQKYSWVAETDLVIAEETSGPGSVRRVPCAVIPQHVFVGQGAPYTIVVPRSAMPTKTYMRPTITITSALPVRFGWGNSISPAISDVARVLDTFTKAPPDPSPRIGFWDKVRLQFHYQPRFVFPGDRASVFFHLKGSRSPYALTGFDAGFAKAWKGNVEFRLGLPNPDHEFFQIISDEYVLGIPNLRDYIDTAATGNHSVDSAEEPDNLSAYAASTISDDQYDAKTDASGEPAPDERGLWIKVCAKCNNGVRWGMGMKLERTCRDRECDRDECHGQPLFDRRCRIFDFIPHWKVHTKTADAIGPHGELTDSYAGFRSDFVHFSLSLTSPCDLSLPNRPDSPESDTERHLDGRNGYNSFHFTPVAIVHFKRWWKLFDSSMSLPIRTGRLFPSAQAPSPKFGRHCATIKYRFSLAPLFISHTYRQSTWEEWRRGETSVLGLKGKIGRFNVDLHQRLQEMVIWRPEMSESKHVKHKVFYMAEADLDSVDLRAVMAMFDEPEKAQFAPPEAADAEEAAPKLSFDQYLARDDEQDWVNVDDFRDSSANWPYAGAPRVHLLPFMTCPRFTYYRHQGALTPPVDQDSTPEGDRASTSPERPKSKFGSEPSHTCLMGSATDTIMVQIRQAQMRLEELDEQVADAEPGSRREEIELRIRAIRRIIQRLEEVRRETQPNLDRCEASEKQHSHAETGPNAAHDDEDLGGPGSLPHITNALFEEWGQWENRYMVHSPLVHVSNHTREVLLKYYYSHRERKGLIYYASASVLRFLRDMAEKHDQQARRSNSRRKSTRRSSTSGQRDPSKPLRSNPTADANRLLDELIDHVAGGVAANEEEEDDADGDRHRFGDHLLIDPDAAQEALPTAFESSPSHLCMFITPQISLKSEVDEKSNLIISAFRAQVKVYHVIDTRITDDPVNSDVLHQTFARLDGLQVFYPRTQLESGSRERQRSFVPIETLIDLRVEPWGFDRVISRSSAALRYDKFNQLRLGSKRNLHEDSVGAGPKLESHFHTSTDRISFECQKVSLSANPEHFAAIFNVVTDLVLYSDPQRKSKDARVEALVFTRDFSRVREVLQTVASLQEQLRNHAYLEQEFQVHLDELDDEGMVELLLTRVEFLRLAEELRFVVEAFTRAQDLQGKKPTSKRTGLQLEARAAELTWHMLDKQDVPFAKFSVLGAEFSWISKQDGSATNRMVVRDLRALNSSPDQIFAEIVSKAENFGEDHPLAKVDIFGAAVWNSLNPVGGIAIIERFELHLHPVRLQLEHRIGKKILDYVFSERDQQRANREDEAHSDEDDHAFADDASSRRSGSPRWSNSPASRSVDSLRVSPSQGQLSLRSGASSDLLSSRASIRSQEERLRKAIAPEALTADVREEGLDADEMRRRAKTNRTFVFVEISSTVLCLTYRSEKEDKSSLPNVYNVTYTTPLIRFRSKTWSYLDLLNDIKRDMIRSVWQQKGQLIGQFLSKTHRRLPMADTRSAAKQAVQASFRARIKSMKARTGTGIVSAQEDALEAGIAPTAKDDDPLVNFGASAYRDSLGSNDKTESLPDLDSIMHDSQADDIPDEDLPFDISAVNLINPQVAYHDEDDSLSGRPASRERGRNEPAPRLTDAPVVQEPEELEPASPDRRTRRDDSPSLSSTSHPPDSPSTPISDGTSSAGRSSGDSSEVIRGVFPNHMRLSSYSSTRSTSSTSSATRSAGLPAPQHGHVQRHGPSKMSDQEKARLILGRSLD